MWGRRRMVKAVSMRYEARIVRVRKARFLAMVCSLFAPFVAPLVLVGSAILIGVGRGFLGRFSCSAACRLACGVFLVVLVLSFRLSFRLSSCLVVFRFVRRVGCRGVVSLVC